MGTDVAEVHGEGVTRRSSQASLRWGTSHVLQSARVFPGMSVHENVLLGGFVVTDDDRAERRAEERYDEFPLHSDSRARQASELSGGQRRPLELARSPMVDPDQTLLDEPSIGLDPRFVDDVFERIEQLNDMGTTMLLVEQNAEKGLSVADRGFLLASGEITLTASGTERLENEEVGRLSLGG
jgi:branched-chain amino acid transport system ATP-binding protein